MEGRKKRGFRHKRHKNLPDNIIFVLWSLGWRCYRFRFVHFRSFAAATLITRYREYFNILSQERIRKRRRMDHYVRYSKSYYTGRYLEQQRCILYHYLSHVRRPAINCRLLLHFGVLIAHQTQTKLTSQKGCNRPHSLTQTDFIPGDLFATYFTL